MGVILVTGIENPQFILVLRQLQHAEQINHGSQAIILLDGISSRNIFQVIKLKSIRWAGHRACAICGENRNAYRFLVGTRRKETTCKT